LQGTPEENKATVQGSLSYYGIYSVDEADRTLHLYIESSSFRLSYQNRSSEYLDRH